MVKTIVQYNRSAIAMSPSPFSDEFANTNGHSHSAQNSAQNGYGHPHLPEPSSSDSTVDILSLDRSHPQDIPIPPDTGERFDRARRSAMRVYIVLIAIGVIIGGVTLVGIASLMQHFGLTDVPAQVDPQ
ncbi:MAG: hypothetical protein AB4042_10000 [Leptolyngbyaceae cyanobacterium]